MTTPFRSIPAAVLAGASAVLGGAARLAMIGARTLDPRWRRDLPGEGWTTPIPDLPAMGRDDPDADRDLATLAGTQAPSAVVGEMDADGDGLPDAVVVIMDDDGDGTPDGAMVASVVDVDGDGEPDAVVAVIDADGDGEPDDILVVTTDDVDHLVGGGGDGDDAGTAMDEALAADHLTGAAEGAPDATIDQALGADDLTGGTEGARDATIDQALGADDLTGGTEGAPAGADLSGTGIDLGGPGRAGAAAIVPDADAAAPSGLVEGGTARPSEDAATVLGVRGDADAALTAPDAPEAGTTTAGSIDPDAEIGPVVVTDVTDDDGEEDVYAQEHDTAGAATGDDGGGAAALIDPGAADTGAGGDLAPGVVVDDLPTQEHREDQGTDDPDDDHLRRPESHVAEIAERPVATVVRDIADLSTDELEALFAYESTHRKRKTVLQAIERATAPPAD